MPNQFSGMGKIQYCKICGYKARLAYAWEHIIKKHPEIKDIPDDIFYIPNNFLSREPIKDYKNSIQPDPILHNKTTDNKILHYQNIMISKIKNTDRWKT